MKLILIARNSGFMYEPIVARVVAHSMYEYICASWWYVSEKSSDQELRIALRVFNWAAGLLRVDLQKESTKTSRIGLVGIAFAAGCGMTSRRVRRDTCRS